MYSEEIRKMGVITMNERVERIRIEMLGTYKKGWREVMRTL